MEAQDKCRKITVEKFYSGKLAADETVMASLNGEIFIAYHSFTECAFDFKLQASHAKVEASVWSSGSLIGGPAYQFYFRNLLIEQTFKACANILQHPATRSNQSKHSI